MFEKVNACRICGNADLELVLDLGEQMLTGVFPSSRDQKVTTGPLQLVKCTGSDACCGLLQLGHSYDLSEMYGDNYGYRSGLNPSMVDHLHKKIKRIESMVSLQKGDLIIDIGSNDSTTLQAYGDRGFTLVGVDPTGTKFREYYPEFINLIPDFFSADLVQARFPDQKAKVVTSFSMFYDLEEPMDFMRQVADVLADDGIWVFEQSYMPLMLDTNSYDTVCHEHLEFYALKQIEWMTRRTGLHIIDVEFNDINGGSFSVTVRKSYGEEPVEPQINDILERERSAGLDTVAPFHAFAERVSETRKQLRTFLARAQDEGKTVAAIGASTKGNVLLQYCGITSNDVFGVGEVNPEKFGKMTPGTFLPIVRESDLLTRKPDYLIALPWHFRRFFETSAAFKGQTLVFPLPHLDIVEVK